MLFAIPIVVHVEAAIQSEPRVEDEGANERSRPISRLLQHGREGRQLRTEAEQPVGPHAVDRRGHGRQNRRVRGQRQRRDGVRACQTQSFRGEPIEHRSQRRRSTERSHTVRAERVDRDQEHIAIAAGRVLNGRHGGAAPDDQRHGAGEQHENDR